MKYLWFLITFANIFYIATLGLSDDKVNFAINGVQIYGAKIGGSESIGSLVEMQLRDLKPQSNRGIEIIGWEEIQIEKMNYKVTYTYFEHGERPIVLCWRINLITLEIIPMTDLSKKLIDMAESL